jgi:hypothetical protein
MSGKLVLLDLFGRWGLMHGNMVTSYIDQLPLHVLCS